MKNNWKIINHPLVESYLTVIRNKNSDHKSFLEAFKKISQLTVYPVTEHLKNQEIEISTLFAKIKSKKVSTLVTLIPIIRAGLGMLETYMEMLENFQVGHILIQRIKGEKDVKVKNYYSKIPQLNHQKDNLIIILEPMIASATTLESAIANVKKTTKVTNKQIIIVSFLVSKYAQEKIESMYQDLTIFTIKIDPILNEKKYIVPGIGDAGDLFFNT